MEGWERIKFIMEQEGLNKNSFSKEIGLSNNVTITRLINEQRKPQAATCQKIIDRFPQYSLNWLIHGEGEIYASPKTITENTSAKETVNGEMKENGEEAVNTNYSFTPNATQFKGSGFMNVPLVQVRAQCGYLSGYGDNEYMESLPSLPVIVDKEYHGKYMAFEAAGDSMDDGSRDSICDKDIVLAREIQRHLWLNKLHIRDWYFVIVHRTDGVSIKQITEHDVEHGIITCHSLNNMFHDYQVRLDEVAELYNVIKVIDRSMRL